DRAVLQPPGVPGVAAGVADPDRDPAAGAVPGL
ncbi:MAG: hypothetical protein AVDCRST_MAG66-78, partial [uncultured Pseudonocardia sp.]